MSQSTYSVHVVEMIRDNCITEPGKNRTADFFLFDYFDLLYHTELTEKNKNYLNYLGIMSPFNNIKDYKVSYKYLTLYQKNKFKIIEDPFEKFSGEGLSNTPFLGVIQITLCAENYKKKYDDIEEFLCECEQKILKIVDECIEENGSFNGKKHIYRSSSMGDFCLILRTDSVDMIHRIAYALNDTQYKKSQDICVYAYTNVGMECKLASDGSYCTLSSDFIEKHADIMFALRFSAPMKFAAKLKQCGVEPLELSSEISQAKGLFGRYDYFININIKEFAEIYPVLCKKKLGVPSKSIDKQDVSEKSKLSMLIEEAVGMNINERILVSLPELEHVDILSRIDEKTDSIITKNKQIYCKIEELNNWRKFFSEEYREFQELYHYMMEMCRIFLPVGVEKDAYINWLVFCEDMDTLCNCINLEMQNYANISDNITSEEKLKKYRYRLLIHWRANIQSINQYTRLIQNVNYQTFQSPVYEIQTQISTEKIMVAYREVMEKYLLLYTKSMEHDKELRDIISAYIYPDMREAGVSVDNFFAPRLASDRIRRAISCTVPSFEYFGRLYDLLPWIIHECSHQMRILDREMRNKFVVEFVLDYVFEYFIFFTIRKVSYHKISNFTNVYIEDLVECMVEYGYEKINDKGSLINEDFEGLVQKLKGYMQDLFKKDNLFLEDYEKLSSDLDKNKILMNLLNVSRSMGIVSQILQLAQEIDKKENALDEFQEIIEIILKNYNHQLKNKLNIKINCKKLIQLEDFQFPVNILNDKLKSIENICCYNKLRINEQEVLKNYCYSIKRLYENYDNYKRIVEINLKEDKLKDFWKSVFCLYIKKYESRDYSVLNEDPTLLYLLRSIGLQKNGKERFCSLMERNMKEISLSEIKKMIDFRITQYRETCADIIMAMSLQLNSFGYCRQVLQTVSDARFGNNKEWYGSINYERFRVVAAVLLHAEGETIEKYGDNISINAKNIIDNSKKYCEDTLKCVRDILLKKEVFLNNEEKKDLLHDFLGIMYEQLSFYLDNMDKENYRCSMLYLLLHQRKSHIPEAEINIWKKYESIKDDLISSFYQFWRLERFCIGLDQILTNNKLVVPKKIFEHIETIRMEVAGGNGIKCKWERNLPDCLVTPKKNVGEFYNHPEQVYKLKTYSKLENTIDFIQNYYYHNRFRIMEELEEKWTD